MSTPRRTALIARLFAAGLVAAAFLPSHTRAQALRGTLSEWDSGRAVADAQVVLLGEEGDTAASSRSSQDGSFLVGTAGWGTFIVSITRMGYRPLAEGPVRLIPDDTVTVAYEMRPVAVALDPVVVRSVATLQYLQKSGFYDRQRRGFGHHLDPPAIENRQYSANYVSDLLVGIPGVLVSGRAIRLTGMITGPDAPDCGGPRFYVDDVEVHLEDGGWIEDVVRPVDIRAIEVYRRPGETPIRYTGSDNCGGAILIWTRRGADRQTP